MFKKLLEKIYNKGKNKCFKEVENMLINQKKNFIITANPETIIYATKDKEVEKMFNDKNVLIIPDGIGVVKAAKILGIDLKERIAGIDIAIKLLELGNESKKSIYFFGSKQEVIDDLLKVVKEKYSNLKVAGYQNGYVKDRDKIMEDIIKKEPDIVLVALGIPDQEKLIYKHLNKFKKGIFVGVGGSFDVISGHKKRAPKIFIKLNLEWLYRIIKEPSRLKRFYNNNIKFIFQIKKEKKEKNVLTNFIIKNKYYILLFIFYFFIALINQYFVFKFDFQKYFDISMLYFCLFWSFIFILIRRVLPTIIGKYLTLLLQIVLILITIANYFFIGYFDSIFSWKDLLLSGEGMAFISSIFPLITPKLIITVIFLIILVVITTIYSPKKESSILKSKKRIVWLLLLIIFIIFYIYNINSLKRDEGLEVFNDNNSNNILSNKSITYSEWNNSRSALEICGIYEYLIRDFYLTIASKGNPVEAKRYVEEHIKNYQYIAPEDSEYYRLFEGKNLILVMMESADDWQINEYSAPTITMMKEKGINFTNHHSLHYVTGKTAQSEFIANTGIYPKFNSLIPHYQYVNNNYKYSLANLFKNKGYTVNAFHRTVGSVYNREAMMLSLGYEHYYNIYSLQLTEEEYDLDRYYASKGYYLLTQNGDSKFMSFYITFSNHSPYTKEKQECALHFDEIQEFFPEEKDEQKLCGYAQIYETDLFFKELLTRLEEDGILEDTVIIAFSDHPNGLYLSSKESEKNNYTEMFIYNSTLEHKDINRLTSTINILPMINNLFGLDSPYYMASYDPLTSEESYLIYSDYTYFNGDEYLPLTDNYYEKLEMSQDILISDYYNN